LWRPRLQMEKCSWEQQTAWRFLACSPDEGQTGNHL
jgi:hypothetical protein